MREFRERPALPRRFAPSYCCDGRDCNRISVSALLARSRVCSTRTPGWKEKAEVFSAATRLEVWSDCPSCQVAADRPHHYRADEGSAVHVNIDRDSAAQPFTHV